MSSTSTSSSMNYLITGAARGVGRALALRLHSAGHRVYLLDSVETELQHTLGLLSTYEHEQSPDGDTTANTHARGRCFAGRVVDVSDLPVLRASVADVSTFFDGKLDVLINNAMAMPHTLPENVNRAENGAGEASMVGEDDAVTRHWDRQVAVGLSAPFHLTRWCVPLLRRQGWRNAVRERTWAARPGCVVNVGSTRASMAEDDHEGYSAVKAGLSGLSQSMSVSLGLRYGIRVNSIILGWIDVAEQNEKADEEEKEWGEALTVADHEWHPAGRVGTAEDVLKAVRYLVDSDFVTGSEVVVDGGVTRRMVYPE